MHSTLQLVRLLNSRDRWPALFRHAASGSRRIAQHAPPYPLPCQAVNALRPAVPGIKNISEMKNAARALPVKLRLKTLQLSSLDVLALQQACCYQCLECKLSRQDYKLLEDYSNQFAALLASGNLGMLQ